MHRITANGQGYCSTLAAKKPCGKLSSLVWKFRRLFVASLYRNIGPKKDCGCLLLATTYPYGAYLVRILHVLPGPRVCPSQSEKDSDWGHGRLQACIVAAVQNTRNKNKNATLCHGSCLIQMDDEFHLKRVICRSAQAPPISRGSTARPSYRAS